MTVMQDKPIHPTISTLPRSSLEEHQMNRSPHNDQPTTISSNSIIIANLPRIFFHQSLQDVLRGHFNSYGPTQSWIALPNLSKILVVYPDSICSQMAKDEMDELVFDESEIRELVTSLLNPLQEETTELVKGLRKTVIKVFFGPQVPPSTPINQTSKDGQQLDLDQQEGQVKGPQDLLKPPNLDKNFLISPPGSPPVGWEQIVEDAPNQKDLADDLCQRLRFLSVDNQGDGDEDQFIHPTQPTKEGASLNEILLVPACTHRQLPALKIQQIEALKSSPGMDIHLVKATIESLRNPHSSKISPTPMPQIH